MTKMTTLAVLAIVTSLGLLTAGSFAHANPVTLAKKTTSSSSTSNHGGGNGSVPLILVKTGNAALDKTIQSFYNCIKKTGHTGGTKSEPSKTEVINCYSKTFKTRSTITGGGA